MLYVYENSDDTITVHTLDSIRNTFYSGYSLPDDFRGDPSRGIYLVNETVPPPVDSPFKKVINGPLVKQGGLFAQEYTIEDVTEEERANILNYQWQLVRADRDNRLGATDWIVSKHAEAGTPVPEAWATFRQALRDVTSQEDPFNITWPTLEV